MTRLILKKEMREHGRKLRRLGKELDVNVSAPSMGGAHPYVTFERLGLLRKFSFPGTTSDHRAFKNSLMDARQVMLGMVRDRPDPRPAEVQPKEKEDKPMVAAGRPSMGAAGPARIITSSGAKAPPDMFLGLVVPATELTTIPRGPREFITPEARRYAEARDKFVLDAVRKGAAQDNIAKALSRRGPNITSAGVSSIYNRVKDPADYRAGQRAKAARLRERKHYDQPSAPRRYFTEGGGKEPPSENRRPDHAAPRPRAPAESRDKLVDQIIEHIRPALEAFVESQYEGQKALRAKAEKWDALKGLVEDD